MLVLLSLTAFAAQKDEITWINGLLTPLTFEEVVNDSDLIVKVKVLERVETIHYEHDDVTKFRAEVKKTYKGNIDTDYVEFYQAGAPERQYKQNPLLEEKKQYILFLNEVESPYGPAYLITGEGYGRFDLNNGKVKQQLQSLNESGEEVKIEQLEDLEEEITVKVKKAKDKAKNKQ